MVIKPDNDMRLDMHVDTDFAGMFDSEEGEDPSTVKVEQNGY